MIRLAGITGQKHTVRKHSYAPRSGVDKPEFLDPIFEPFGGFTGFIFGVTALIFAEGRDKWQTRRINRAFLIHPNTDFRFELFCCVI